MHPSNQYAILLITPHLEQCSTLKENGTLNPETADSMVRGFLAVTNILRLDPAPEAVEPMFSQLIKSIDDPDEKSAITIAINVYRDTISNN